MAQPLGGGINLVENRGGIAAEVDGFATPIAGRFLSFDPAIPLQAIENPGQGRAFDADTLGQLPLGQWLPGIGKVREGGPFPLAQAERAQTAVELVPPVTGGSGEQDAYFFGVEWSHGSRFVSTLTNLVS